MSVSNVPQSGTPETYQKNSTAAVGSTFVDDFSTPTRQHIFTASATRPGNEVVIEIDYFSDVSALNWVNLTTALEMLPDQIIESSSGRPQFGSSNCGSYTMTYTLDCRKL